MTADHPEWAEVRPEQIYRCPDCGQRLMHIPVPGEPAESREALDALIAREVAGHSAERHGGRP